MIDRAFVGAALPTVVVDTSAKEIRRFAAAIGDGDPVYRDVTAARAAGFSDIPVPPTYGMFLMLDRPDPSDVLTMLGIDITKLLHAEQSFAYHVPIVAGEHLTIAERVAEIYEKKGGRLEFVVLDAEVRKGDGSLAMSMRRVLVVRHG